ncbi:MAG: dihydropteroate synthase [Roseburia sp.]|nr:dihydropteroate synthase [Ruminococcus sp.]MCM1155568.1 dihydropteroate synthase [Roseburia sp.]MCM1242407.1 dihydropteroate synthase [Roseburia sp.]
MKIGNKEFQVKGHTYVMGVLNVTPDSFSDGGKFNQMDAALHHVEEMITDGMDVLDIGGESTRPGYTMISDEEEISRVVPVIEQIKSRFDIPVSLDTYKSGVARAGIAAGVDMINDIWGLKYDGELAKVIADAGISCTLLHDRKEAVYQDLMQDILVDLSESVQIARQAGIADDRILIDPGVGFGKTYENNLEVIRRLEILHSFGYPIVLGASRKSVIGTALDLPVEQRLEGTLATTVFGAMKGAMFVRVHDVKENVRIIKMTEAIMRG